MTDNLLPRKQTRPTKVRFFATCFRKQFIVFKRSRLRNLFSTSRRQTTAAPFDSTHWLQFERQSGNPGTGVLMACRREIRAGEGLVFGKYTNKIRFLLSETMKEVLYSVFDPVMTQSPKSQICSSTTASTRARGRSMKGAAGEGENDKGFFQWHGRGWCDDLLLMLRKG